MSQQNYRLINIDKLDPESSSNFPVSTLSPPVAPISITDVQSLAGQIRQLLRGGDTEGALRGALENVPYGGDDRSKVCQIPRVRFLIQYP
jgi:actin related protein 2/3 complex, subunit 5